MSKSTNQVNNNLRLSKEEFLPTPRFFQLSTRSSVLVAHQRSNYTASEDPSSVVSEALG